MDNFDLKKFLIENKLTYQETMKEKALKLSEETIPFFHTQQILKLQDLSKTLPQQEAELKVGLNVLPKQAYFDEKDINSAIGKITKIEGDEVTVKKNNGAEEKRKKSDLIHIIDFTSESLKKVEDDVFSIELPAQTAQQIKKAGEMGTYKAMGSRVTFKGSGHWKTAKEQTVSVEGFKNVPNSGRWRLKGQELMIQG